MSNLLAQIDIPGISTQFTDANTLVGTVTSRFLLFAIGLSGFYFLLRFILAAFTYLTSLGDAAKIQAAQKQMLNGFIGLLIVLSAYFFAQIISYVFGINFL